MRLASTAVCLLAIVLTTGCAAQKAERQKLINDNAELQGKLDTTAQQRDAAMTLQAETQKKLDDATSELNSTKDELAKAQAKNEADQKAAEEKIAKLKAADAAALKRSQIDQDATAKELKKAQDDLATAKAASDAQANTLGEKLSTLQKQVDTLTTENTQLKAELAKASIPGPASQPAETH